MKNPLRLIKKGILVMMNTLLIRDSLEPEELTQLFKEFPQYTIQLIEIEKPLYELGVETCSQIEILYGCVLSKEELNLVSQLRWIHCPSPYLDNLCLDAIKKLGNILISTTKEKNLVQIGEFAIAAAMAFSKKLFYWMSETRDPMNITLAGLRKGMWKVNDKIFLQIGLGTIGTEIVKRAKLEGFKVWGVQKLRLIPSRLRKMFFFRAASRYSPYGRYCLACHASRANGPFLV